jgi:hypothetical protein
MKPCVYVLANDAVAEWLIALFRSIRLHMPEANVRVIPFDERIDGLERLKCEMEFEFLEHESFDWLVEIGRRLEIGRTELGPNWFRRFAAFLGGKGPFLYLDARVLVLSDLLAGFDAVEAGSVDFIHFGGDANQSFGQGQVRARLSAAGRCFGLNSGMWISRAGLFSRQDMERAADFCEANREQMNPRNTDQFFLNVLCAHSNARVVNFADLESDFGRDPWAFSHRKVFRQGNDTRVWDHGGVSHCRRLPLVHWAGIRMSSSMPLRSLWTQYRYDGNRPLHVRLEPLTSLPARIVEAARRSMWVRRFVAPENAGLRPR